MKLHRLNAYDAVIENAPYWDKHARNVRYGVRQIEQCLDEHLDLEKHEIKEILDYIKNYIMESADAK